MNKGIWVAPASNKNSKIHMELTVLNPFEKKRYWGFEESHASKFKNLEIGDFLVFYQNKKITFRTKIVNKYISKKDSFKFWPASTEEQNWPLIVELEEPQRISIDIKEVNSSLGYKENFKFMSNTFFKKESNKASILIEMIKDIYEESFIENLSKIKKGDFIKVVSTPKPKKTKSKRFFNIDAILSQKRKMNEEKIFQSQQRNGKKAEEIAVEFLKKEYDLVKWMHLTNNTSPFDIYCEKDDQKTFVEVKGTSSPSINTDFFMSNNEVQFAEYCYNNDLDYRLIRIININGKYKIFDLDVEKILDPNNSYLTTNVFRVDMSSFLKKSGG